jgi:uncharacterized delta-60 repeat protein
MKNKIRILSLIICSTFISIYIFAQTGSLDKSFGVDGIVTTKIGVGDAKVASIALQSDFKIIAAGYSSNSRYLEFALARYDSNGSIDSSFGNNGEVITEIGSGNCSIRSLVIQPDGKLVVAGYAPDDSIYSFALARYCIDGSLDNSFGTNGIVITSFGAFSGIFSSVIQVDGKIVAVGFTGSSTAPGGSKFALARYNQNGSLDSTFGINGKMITAIRNIGDAALSVGIQSDEKIVVSGWSYHSNNTNEGPDIALVRYNINGILDTTFGVGGKIISEIGESSLARKLNILDEKKILISGSTFIGSKSSFVLARYNADGSIDNSFGVNGFVTTSVGTEYNNYAESSVIQPDKKIIVTGFSNNGLKECITLVRYSEDGSLDDLFGNNGIDTTTINSHNSYASAVVMQFDGKILVGGTTRVNNTVANFALVRFISGLNLGVIDNPIPDHAILIYPNPIKPNTILEYTLNSNEEVTIQLINVQGKTEKIFIYKQTQASGIHQQAISLPVELSNGTYFILVTTENNQFSIKIIK